MPCGDCGQAAYEGRAERLSMVLRCRDEIDKLGIIKADEFRNHPEKYNKRLDLDGLTDSLCRKLCVIDPDDIRDMSLELQGWWIQHQIDDIKRERE